MKKLGMCLVLMCLGYSVFAQQNFTKHKVEAGETVTIIAQKYQTSPASIFQLNPDAQSGLKPDMMLLIPKGNGVLIREAYKKDKGKKTHLVSAKETLYSLMKRYDRTEEDFEKANPGLLANGLKVGDVIVIPGKKSVVNTVKPSLVEVKKERVHTVEAKETLYAIAKLYNVSVAELELANPGVKDGLQEGFVLKIPQEKADTTAVKANQAIISVPVKPNMTSYTVQPKETLYGIATKSGFSQEELIALNSGLKEGLKEGMVLYFPAKAKNSVAKPPKKRVDLTQSLRNATTKRLVLLLPFNISKIESDTTSVRTRIKNDKFLNMTLDFYSGVVKAIDSAKALGLNLEIKIFDSQETKNSSNVASIFKQSNFKGTDLVIGPFYQSNVEAAAQILMKDSILIISPLSKEANASLPNLIQTLPSDEMVKDGLFDFMRKKQGVIIGVVDTKKIATRKYLASNQPDVKLVNFETIEATNNGIRAMLEKGKKNYVVLDTENTYRIKMIISTLLALRSEYDIQLVILDDNPKLDSDEIKVEHLASLKLLYASIGKQISANEKSYFIKEYRQSNMVSPSSYAIRGFDIVFDAILRLSQAQSFKETLLTTETEQFENKFSYEKQSNKGFQNKGFYILHYDEDLSIKVAN